MSLTIEEFDINELKARIGKPLHRMKIANFYNGDDFRKVPNIRAYGVMRVEKGKFGEFFELDLKDDESEEFFKSLVESLRMFTGVCFDEKPWNLKSPFIEYGPFYSIRCKIYASSQLNDLKVRENFRGYCEIRPYYAFCGKTKGITFALKKYFDNIYPTGINITIPERNQEATLYPQELTSTLLIRMIFQAREGPRSAEDHLTSNTSHDYQGFP